jgi:hypothetical protein
MKVAVVTLEVAPDVGVSSGKMGPGRNNASRSSRAARTFGTTSLEEAR